MAHLSCLRRKGCAEVVVVALGKREATGDKAVVDV